MATNESSFKREFRASLQKHYGDAAALWTNNDMFRAGLPDFSALHQGKFFAIEAKFVKAPPERPTSKVLGHELSEIQAAFLSKTQRTGGFGVVLIGFSDVAVAIPFQQWAPQLDVPGTNITLERVRLIAHSGLGFPKVRGQWDVRNFFEHIARGGA